MISRRVLELTRYQDATYASRYTALVDKVKAAERARGLPGDALTGAVARGYYKLLAYKDEYEVARLYSDVEYLNALKATFEGDAAAYDKAAKIGDEVRAAIARGDRSVFR